MVNSKVKSEMAIKTDINETELRTILARGEDSRHQFKRDCTQVDALAAELIAFANSVGGRLFIGVTDDGKVSGLTATDVARLNQLLSNAASQNIRPPINPVSTNVQTDDGLVIVVSIAEGLNKPYMDVQGRIWVKSGADKRHVTAREEMQRLFQQSALVYADEVPAKRATIDDLNLREFGEYFKRRYRKSIEASGLALPKLLQNLSLVHEGVPNLAGLLLFGNTPNSVKPAFVIKAVVFPGTVLHDSRYLDSEDIDGNLPEQYRRGMAFIKRNLRHVQGDQGFNSPGLLEVPDEVFEEVLVNALVHRDYFICAPIRLLIYADRIEIISPGHLPNHLDVEQIRFGLSNLRNPTLASHAFYMLPYRGLGSGIPRAVEACPTLELIDDRRGNQFKVVIRRLNFKESQPESQPESRPESQPESLVSRVLLLLATKPATKAEISSYLGQKEVSGQLNKVIRDLLMSKRIEYTIPDKPNSRLQQYRIRRVNGKL